MTEADLLRVRTALAAVPGVSDVAVVADDTAHNCYVVLDRAMVQDDATRASLARQEEWQYLFDSIYGSDLVVDDDMDMTAFSSAYTREPFSVTDMREWLNATVAQVRARLPRRPRILEVGCGTGLILGELAPGSERYAVVDFSASALARLRRSLDGKGLDQVEFHHAGADDLPAELHGFDAVVIAQVAQYFPSEEYLRRVVTGALTRVRPTGFVYIDVRSLPLLETFHVSVARFGAPREPADAVLAKARQRLSAEDELVVHPAFFAGLADITGAWVRVDPRRGRRAKEMTAYRYDALLYPKAPVATGPRADWRSWHAEEWTQDRLRDTLTTERPDGLALTGIPHAMLAEDLADHHRLATQAGQPVPEPPPGVPVQPDDIRDTAAAAGYHAVLSGLRGDADGTFDAWLAPTSPRTVPPLPGPEVGLGPLTSDPSLRKTGRDALRRLRALLESRLPSQRAPITVVLVDQLPRTHDGQLDLESLRRAEPVPGYPVLTL